MSPAAKTAVVAEVSLVLATEHQADVLAEFVTREGRWFEFVPAVDWCAQGPEQWCWAVMADGELVGFGRLSHQSNLGPPVLIASYGVLEGCRRRGYGRAILRALHDEADRQGVPLLAAVLPENVASLALCRSHFGEFIWTGNSTSHNDIVVFGDAKARAAFGEPT